MGYPKKSNLYSVRYLGVTIESPVLYRAKVAKATLR